ncbi:MAG TPA: glycosyltransferase, partial [Steroidobacteraceae bacterium]|nr:glycosyltransferase [Steroidobacteraceae bacterium]
MLRVLHVIETIAPREGGPPRVVAGLARAQRELGIEADVLCGDGQDLADHLEHWQAHAAGFAPNSVHAIGSGGQTLLARRAELHEWLRAHLARFDLVHVHHLWRLVPTVTANACRRSHIPYLIAPHTGLSPWALAQKRAKKSLARWLIWDRLLRSAAGFHALNELEAAEIRDCIGAAAPPISVVPNGVSLTEYPGLSAPAAPAALENVLSSPQGAAPFVLFLARLHIMKGPDLLLEAFAQVAAAHPQLKLVFAGPDFGMLAQLRKRVAAHRLSDRVHFLGLVSGAERYWLLNNALCVSQPSRDEGFSLSILEALACARPVVISDQCKFPQVAASGAGVVV